MRLDRLFNSAPGDSPQQPAVVGHVSTGEGYGPTYIRNGGVSLALIMSSYKRGHAGFEGILVRTIPALSGGCVGSKKVF
jgi:hypothetical protein